MKEHLQKQIYCNCCGETIGFINEQQVFQADCLEVQKNWGYFSNKDGKKHLFHICETCYDKWLKGFAIPVEETDETELLST